MLKIPFTLHFLYAPLSPWLSCYQALKCWHTSIFNCSSWAAILIILNTSCNVALVSYLVCACVCFAQLTINRFKLENIIILHVTFHLTIVLESTKTYSIYNNTVKPRRIIIYTLFHTSKCKNLHYLAEISPCVLTSFVLSLKLVHEHVLMTPEEKTELLQR